MNNLVNFVVVLVLLVSGCAEYNERQQRKHDAITECMKQRPADSEAYFNCRLITCGQGGC